SPAPDAHGVSRGPPPARVGTAAVRAPLDAIQRHAGRRRPRLPRVVSPRRGPASRNDRRAAHARVPRLLPAPAGARRSGHRLAGSRDRADAASRRAAVMKAVLYFRIKEIRWTVGDEELRAAQARFPDVELVRVTEDQDLPAALADADIFFGFHFPPELFA